MNNNAKSATTAGLLGIFLGGFGAHDWYLGRKKQGIIHVSMVGVAILLMVISWMIVPRMSILTVLRFGWLFGIMSLVEWGLIGASSLWGFIEGIIILSKGDAGLMQATSAGVQGALGGEQHGAWQQNAMQQGAMQQGMAMQQNVVPKKPMDPTTKKKLIIGISAAAGVIVVVVIAVAVIGAMSKVDYEPAYEAVLDLKPKVQALYNQNCANVVSAVNSEYISEETYEKYIEACQVSTEGLEEGIKELGETAGVKRNADIKERFSKFEKSAKEAMPDVEDLEAKLKLYRIWHKYIVDVSEYDLDKGSEAEIKAMAELLTSSGNEELKAYGEGWLEKTLPYAQAYWNVKNTSYSDPNYSSLRAERDLLRTEQSNYVKQNKPDIKTLVPLETGSSNLNTFYEYYLSLQSMIAKEYRSQE